MNKKLLAAAVVATLIMCAVVIYGVGASNIPDGVEVFVVDDHTCVLAIEASGQAMVLECFCPCEEECDVQTEVAPTPTGRPGQTATVIPTDPVGTPTPQDTPTSPPPEPTDKPKCNRGIGNDSEGCDPGNSSGQGLGQGRDAGEDRDEHKKDR